MFLINYFENFCRLQYTVVCFKNGSVEKKQFSNLNHFENIFNLYQKSGVGVLDKTILEIGSGDQIFTSLFFLNAGATRVILIDPKLDGDRSKSKMGA